jgi:hypothetical protein
VQHTFTVFSTRDGYLFENLEIQLDTPYKVQTDRGQKCRKTVNLGKQKNMCYDFCRFLKLKKFKPLGFFFPLE